MQLIFQLISKVFSGVEVRAPCSTLEIVYSILASHVFVALTDFVGLVRCESVGLV